MRGFIGRLGSLIGLRVVVVTGLSLLHLSVCWAERLVLVDEFVYRYHPQIRQRSTIFRLSELDWGTQSQDWARYQRLLLDSMDAPIPGHGFGDWWGRYAEDHPEYFAWQGISQEYVAMSDRDVTFANHVGRTLKRRFPDQDLTVVMFAYGYSCPAPIEAIPDDNVLICSVANFLIRDRELRERHLPWFDDWSKVTDRLLWRPNLGSGGGWRLGLPFIPIQMSGEDMKFIGERGVIGIGPDTVWEHWSTHGPLYYLIGQMAWDPTKDPAAILEDYYQRAFGPAAADIEAYWSLMEELRDANVDGGLDWGGVRERMGEAGELLDAAAAKVADSPTAYGERVAFVRAGYDWSQIVLENIALAKQFREGGRQNQSLVERADANWQKALELRENHSYALHWSRLYGPPSRRATKPFGDPAHGSAFDMNPRR